MTMKQAKKLGGRMSLLITLTTVMVTLSFFALQLSVDAGVSSGANGCGTFANAVDLAPAGDFIVPTAPEPGSLNDRPSEGKLITKSLLIQGGWATPGGGCNEANQIFTTTADLLTFGYTFTPNNRSVLTHNSGPVLQINHTGSMTIENMMLLNQGSAVTQGAVISGTISGATTQLLIDNTVISGGMATLSGGGLYLEVRNGARLVISGSQILSNTGGTGGGVEIHVFDDSEVVIQNSQISGNRADGGNGGGGRIVVESGTVTVRNNTFANNQALSGNGGGLSIEGVGSSANVFLFNNSFNNNSASNQPDIFTSGNLTIFDQQIFLPAVLKNKSFLAAEITNIALSGDTYVVEFTTSGFTPQPGDLHVHFFFDTVPPEEAGNPGSGPWKIHESPDPFAGYTVSDRPVGATQMCILVANADHSVQAGTGNCFNLP